MLAVGSSLAGHWVTRAPRVYLVFEGARSKQQGQQQLYSQAAAATRTIYFLTHDYTRVASERRRRRRRGNEALTQRTDNDTVRYDAA